MSINTPEINWSKLAALPIAEFKKEIDSLTLTELENADFFLFLGLTKHEEYLNAKTQELNSLKLGKERSVRKDFTHKIYKRTLTEYKSFLAYILFTEKKLVQSSILNNAAKSSIINHFVGLIFGYTKTELTRVFETFLHLNNDSNITSIRHVKHARRQIFTYLQLNCSTQFLSDNESLIIPIAAKNLKTEITFRKHVLDLLAEFKKGRTILNCSTKSVNPLVENHFKRFFKVAVKDMYTLNNPIVAYWVDQIKEELKKEIKIDPKNLERYELTKSKR